MEGVKSLSTLMAASPSRWYSSKCSPTKTRSGQSCRAPPSRHTASCAEGRAGRGRENDAAADRNRLAAQARVKQPCSTDA